MSGAASKIVLKDNQTKLGWEGRKPEVVDGITGMMHDGDQQLFNPYGHMNGNWAMYSFRPSDAMNKHPMISITPASFRALSSIDTMLDNVPYVVVKEYYFKNQASTMINFVKKIMGMVKQAKDSPVSNADEKSNGGAGDAKSTGDSLLDTIKEKFEALTIKPAVIDLPYILYCCLRRKLYGNVYVFPYLPQSGSTVINNSSNASEWSPDNKGGTITGWIKNMISGAAEMVGNIAIGLTGSQAKFTNLFPAPSWGGPDSNSDRVSFSFDLILINDNVIFARNNYMCVNTIIHNNRWMQKAILAFPGALYELWLPTGQRHLMCTGDFKLYPLGLNRHVPTNFFRGDKNPAANFQIGYNLGEIELKNPNQVGHEEKIEVVPDAYKLSVTFASCLANNMNTAVFQYYVEMSGYDELAKPASQQKFNKSDEEAAAQEQSQMNNIQSKDGKNPVADADALDDSESLSPPSNGNTTTPPPASPGKKSALNARSTKAAFARAVDDLLDSVESFDESTYNKRLTRLKTQLGEEAVNADSVVLTIRSAQGHIREANELLGKLYGAKDSNLWYKPYVLDEIYTTLEPDPRQMLRKQYREKLDQMRLLQRQIEDGEKELAAIASQLSTKTTLESREPLLASKVGAVRNLNQLRSRKTDLVDDLVQIDIQLVGMAFDEQDRVVSVKRNNLTVNTFKHLWNEKILNSYERDKLQYLTSKEKERYFQDKIRELAKFDKHGILNHQDWFFRVAVLDGIVSEMQRLISWFKQCSYDDFDTIYKIVRKLKLLQLDLESTYSAERMDINKTNLFFLSDEDLKGFTKIDELLDGSTLYDLFQSQLEFNVVEEDDGDGDSQTDSPTVDSSLLQEQQYEIAMENQRKVRQDVVARVWGSETELTRAAFKRAAEQETLNEPLEIGGFQFQTLNELKSKIIELKLTDRGEADEQLLQALLGAFTNLIGTIKEGLVIEKMNEMYQVASEEISKKDAFAKADVMVGE